jgi:hypothetical protein
MNLKRREYYPKKRVKLQQVEIDGLKQKISILEQKRHKIPNT